ncbi:hypothetical protein [Roseibacillus ishigakijimensis]|uniref:Verru_Chthon cassette protein A n=1 Tax=Roseibacillus ishigakijimensis TaxID=454146 RepID=A0A934RUS2_9BACT|nr:hypothetical protein [Roseibacillus ishigakijimensis]MBK1834540.1 hypothetical protein [Roseibacillus ishigakijimensis]
MKTSTFPRTAHQNDPGFSLIVTVTMMVLLSLIAVGILSLSSTVLRSSNSEQARLEAQANARLALQLALGQLQEAAGPDQRITAPANLLNAGESQVVTGVWESLALDPNGGQDLDGSKRSPQSSATADGEFITWLNSDSFGREPNPEEVLDRSNQSTPLFQLPTGESSDQVTARVISLNQGRGGVAWTTVDESVKARFDLPEEEQLAVNNTSESEVGRDRLRNPARQSPETLEAIAHAPSVAEAAKLASFGQGALLSGNSESFAEHFNDLTPWSLGVLSNPVEGGLKKDLTVAFESETDPLEGKFAYSQDEQALAPAEPYMSTLREYYRLYKEHGSSHSELLASVPDDYNPFEIDRRTREQTPAPVAPEGNLLLPVVSRVNVVFSLVGHEAHGNWLKTIPESHNDARRTQMVYMIYTPVVTLHNPYTKPITVNELTLSFKDLPLAFRMFRNGQPQVNEPALLSKMHIDTEHTANFEDTFECTLAASANASQGGAITLAPGEARVFGLNHRPGTTWSSITNYYAAGSSNLTNSIVTRPGYNSGNSGFVVDWLNPDTSGRTSDAKTGVFGVRTTDSINVEIRPKVPLDSRGRPHESFTIDIAAKIGNSRRAEPIGAYRYTYGTEQRLIEAFEEGEHPVIGKFSFPYLREKDWRYNELSQPNLHTTPIESWTAPKQFAVFTMATRTAHDSLYATRPGRDTNFAHNVLDMDITKNHPAKMPMEVSFLPVIGSPGSSNNPATINVWSKDDPRTFFFSGWTSDLGFPNYPSIEIPRTPPTNLTQFRNANLASSGHFPMTAKTIGESFAHPLIPANRAIDRGSDFDYNTLDHSWLANNTFYDNFFLSGLRDEKEFSDFLSGEKVPFNSRSQQHLPVGQSEDSAVELYRAPEGWTTSAAFQMIKAPFNVNSTSVQAWKAVLASGGESEVPVIDPTNMEEELFEAFAPFPRLLDGPSGPVDPKAGFLGSQERWTGFRHLDPDELERLAEAIVEVVRERGPFTSLSEFVNRRLDNGSSPLSRQGALQQAIEQAGLNDGIFAEREVSLTEAQDYEYANPEAALGDVESAAAVYLTQGDLLDRLANSLTVRGDTFVIRAYGDAKNKAGQILASATCEAVVQRLPDYLAPESHLGAKPAETARSDEHALEHEVNERFGRRFVVRSFRWLSQEEV